MIQCRHSYSDKSDRICNEHQWNIKNMIVNAKFPLYAFENYNSSTKKWKVKTIH